ncbi:hypothetical protein M5X11_12355 [Paenibacillus alginolyticus]|uniref:hypothetical protein n=1 Tax=Paenibacillus alginolyticus TaxID=59839 RepID=UPI0004104E00|nr:hypothetical protein [Paenibacillus alginolyticus]MCY9665747.1 hypothetical protein [Paenibacillus alginolyticus]
MSQNNEVLFKEIEAVVKSTYFEKMLSKQQECILEFKTRNGHLSMRYDNDVEILVGGFEKKTVEGMDPSQLDYFLDLLRTGLSRHSEVGMSDVIIHSISKRGKIVYFTLSVKEHVKMGH